MHHSSAKRVLWLSGVGRREKKSYEYFPENWLMKWIWNGNGGRPEMGLRRKKIWINDFLLLCLICLSHPEIRRKSRENGEIEILFRNFNPSPLSHFGTREFFVRCKEKWSDMLWTWDDTSFWLDFEKNKFWCIVLCAFIYRWKFSSHKISRCVSCWNIF